ncbi:hypothetical protein MPH_13217 [Macrophomina phaseolina MS6]|uniref:Calpain catalytic domain-containing protein n=1 Tax=Macrophomina phaseolina (strain MS6) TaxID=1126212 RepID=K2RZ25_MACPH|nr:hypothetical protein MPH_13217 [Macrophomina phaseolina MS6]
MSMDSLLKVLSNRPDWRMPVARAVHRVDYIYERPAFTIDGFGASDVQQGGNGDCWWVAAVTTLCSVPGQLERICVARNEACGAYGFVFHRDGDWFPVVVDDNLYLAEPDYSADVYDPTGKEARKYRKRYQTGSEALCFAKCTESDETWLPLLEKAYAKAHGDYNAIAGGFPGEGVEDMTGGVTTTIDTNKVLGKDRLWKELLNANKEFIFATGTPSSASGDSDFRSGLACQHAYSVLEATEPEDEKGNTVRLVRLRNPWGSKDWLGRGDWNGPWSDGSKEWTPYWLDKLNYKFADDGVFWMSFEDMLSRFDQLDRTRLFDEEWNVVQRWTSINVSWITGYIDAKFVVEAKKPGQTVFVLSKLDDRYFKGFEGQYLFELHFLLQKEGSEVGDHIARARPSSAGSWQRSVSAEVDLEEPGNYEVIPMIIATKVDGADPVEEVVKNWAEKNPQKLRQIGLNYDIAHLKAAQIKPEEKSENKPGPEDLRAGPPAETKKQEDSAQLQATSVQRESPAQSVKAEPPPEASKTEPPPESAKEEKPAEAEKEEQPVELAEEDAAQGKPPANDAKGDEEVVPGDSPAVLGPSHEDAPKAKDGQATGPAQTAPRSGTGEPAEKGTPEAKKDENAEARPEERPAEKPEDIAEVTKSSWNAVCSVGLRVFTKDPDVVIRLVSPTTAEEGATLNVDGTAPGATM